MQVDGCSLQRSKCVHSSTNTVFNWKIILLLGVLSAVIMQHKAVSLQYTHDFLTRNKIYRDNVITYQTK